MMLYIGRITMKYYFITLLLISFFLSSCNEPRSQRVRRYSSGSEAFSTTSGETTTTTSTNTESTDEVNEEDEVSDSTESYNPTSSNIPSDASHCSWSTDGISGFTSNHNHIGYYNICQSSSSNTTIYIQVKTPINDSNLCIIPTTSSGGSSTYIGEARCIHATSASQIYTIELYKNRVGYGNYSVSGVIILKDKAYWYPSPYNSYKLSPDAYFSCMNWLASYGDPSLCNAFEMVGEYLYNPF